MNRIKSVNMVFLATVIISVLGSFINAYVYRFTQNYAYIMILSQVLIALPSIIYLKIKNINVVKAIRLNKINLGNIVLIILFTYLITPLMGLINLISMSVVSNSTEKVMNQITSENSLLVSLFLVAFIPCLLEEGVYRGIFYNEYRKVNVIKGIFLSGFLFGLMHGNFNQFSYAFVMGIIFALLIEATDSILSTIIAHFFINGSSIIGLYLLPELNKVMSAVNGNESSAMPVDVTSVITPDVIASYAIYAAVTTSLAFIVFKTIAKGTRRWEYIKSIFKRSSQSTVVLQEDIIDESGNKVEGAKKVITPILIVAIVMCLVLMILNEESIINMLKMNINLN